MPVRIEATLEGEKQLSRRLLVIADGISDWESPLRNIGDELLHTFQANFDVRGGLFGGWPPRAKDQPWPLLERSGDMRGNFDSDVGPEFVKLYNTTPYFKYHQSNQPRSRLPRRVMMKIDQNRKVFIQKAFQQHIISVLRNSKRG